MTRNFRLSCLCLALGLLLCSTQTVAWVEVGGNIVNDTTWSATDTIHVGSSVTVQIGATLTIEPGTVMLFDPYMRLLTLGRLQALGDSDAPIIFSSAADTSGGSPVASGWSGLEIRGATDCLLRHCAVRYALDAIYVRSTEVALESCTIENFYSRGVYVYTDSAADNLVTRLDRCTVRQSTAGSSGTGTAIFVYKCGAVEAQHSRLQDCEYGLNVYGFQSYQPRFDIDNCQIEGHKVDGVHIYTGG